MRKLLFLGLTLLLIVALTGVVGCSSDTQPQQSNNEGEQKQEQNEQAEIKVLTVAIPTELESLDPAMHRDRVTETVIRNMFDGLVTRTTDMEIVPEIAESYEQVTPTEWVFKIREGITFHNGEKLTAEDVAFTFNRIITEGAVDGKSSPRKGLLGTLERVEQLDEYTVKFVLTESWPIFLGMLPFQEIVPKDYIEEKGSDYFAKNPVGAGPFKFVEGTLNEQVIMERYDGYWGGSQDIAPVGNAQVDTVIFKIIPEVSSRIAALQAGDVQIVQEIPPDLVEQLQADPDIEVKMADSTRERFIEINVNKPPFDDVRVRQAMNYAIDYESIVTHILGGNGEALKGPYMPKGFGYNDKLPGYGYNPEKAKELLKEAGYENGFDVVIDAKADEKTATEAVASQLREVGINASVRVWEWGVFKEKIAEGQRLMIANNWGNGSLDPAGILEPKLRTGGRGNYSFYSNARVDELIEKTMSETDSAKRAAYWQEIQEIVYEDAPMVFGYITKELYAQRANVTNWEPSPDGRINLHDVGLK
ncbi:ABC transporter substrate-binding protein [Metallumcola ferriviriculae]|uniref:ABC transporter substrate-binding protein n=1 Tax=Metallumcola ferriviriculae TaxID=3039180 RepID=A0AAU0URE1_9FIRM|nr:ABC transporter substrate-binding protein [Desulfitibacteraceae bacterium MK1]